MSVRKIYGTSTQVAALHVGAIINHPIMSEKALASDWNSAEEDAVWANLEYEKTLPKPTSINNAKVDTGLIMMISTDDLVQ